MIVLKKQPDLQRKFKLSKAEQRAVAAQLNLERLALEENAKFASLVASTPPPPPPSIDDKYAALERRMSERDARDVEMAAQFTARRCRNCISRTYYFSTTKQQPKHHPMLTNAYSALMLSQPSFFSRVNISVFLLNVIRRIIP